MDADVERAHSRLLLSKTKMQQVNIAMQNLSKLRPITQGTQVEQGEMSGIGKRYQEILKLQPYNHKTLSQFLMMKLI